MIPVFVHLGARADAGPVDSAVSRRLVPAGGAADRLTTPMNVSPLGLAAAALPSRRAGAARAASSSGQLLDARAASRGSRAAQLVALWAQRRARPRPRLSPCASCCSDADGLDAARAHAARRRRALSRPRRRSFRPRTACSARRSIWSASRPTPTTSGRGCGRRAGRSTSFPLRRDFEALAEVGTGRRRTIAFVRVDGDGVHEIPVGPGARRHHRARAFPLPGRRRKSAAPRGAARLHAQGHRKALRGDVAASTAIGSPAASPATAPSPTRGPMRRRSKRSPASTSPPRARVAARAAARARAHRQPSGRSRLSRQRRRLRLRPRAVLAPEGGRAAHQRSRVRPSAADGRRRARAASRAIFAPSDAARDARANARALEREIARAARHLRRARRPAGSLSRAAASSRPRSRRSSA